MIAAAAGMRPRGAALSDLLEKLYCAPFSGVTGRAT